MQDRKIAKISNKKRVDRILERVCDAKLNVLIRSRKNTSVAVRGSVSGLKNVDGVATLRITGLSAKGISYLWNVDKIQVEFVGNATKILFLSNIVKAVGAAVHVTKPASLITYDRRKDARYPTIPSQASFISLESWEPGAKDSKSPPITPVFSNLHNWVSTNDVSVSGVCASSRFPAVLDGVEKGQLLDVGIIFPQQEPLEIPVEVRWVRRIKTQNLNTHHSQCFFKFGLLFSDPSSELKLFLNRYIQQLTLADAI